MKKTVISVAVLVVLLVVGIFAGRLLLNTKSIEPSNSQEQEWTKQLENKEFHRTVDIPLEDQEKLKSSCKEFFSVFANYDVDELIKILGSRPEWKNYQTGAKDLKNYLGDITEITIGEPFKIDLYDGIYVPYKIRFKNGYIKEWQVAIRYRYDDGKISWYIDGGI